MAVACPNEGKTAAVETVALVLSGCTVPVGFPKPPKPVDSVVVCAPNVVPSDAVPNPPNPPVAAGWVVPKVFGAAGVAVRPSEAPNAGVVAAGAPNAGVVAAGAPNVGAAADAGAPNVGAAVVAAGAPNVGLAPVLTNVF